MSEAERNHGTADAVIAVRQATKVYRLGDQVGAWASALMTWAGLGSAMAWTAVPLALAWVANAWRLGRRQEEKARALAERYPALESKAV